MRTIAAIGATSVIAHECLRRWAGEPTRFVLVGRDQAQLQRVADDLAARHPGNEATVLVGAFDDADGIAGTVEQVFADGPVDIALVAFGTMPPQEQLADDPAAFAQVLAVNGVWAGLYAQLVARHMLAAGHGRLALIGSVAGDRGRRSNYAYGAGKAMLATLAQGLAHLAAPSQVRVTLVKPGPTATPMTEGLASPVPLADPRRVAQRIVAGIEAGQPVVYVPGRWRLIMAVIRALPARVFNRLDL